MWTYAKKAFVALLLSFVLMYGGLFSFMYAGDVGSPQHEFFSVSGRNNISYSPYTGTVYLPGTYYLYKEMDAPYMLEIHLPNLKVNISVNGKAVIHYDSAPPLIYLNLSRGDKISIWVENDGDSMVQGIIDYYPTDTDRYRLFSITGIFLFVISLALFFLGLSFLYLLLKVEKRRGKFVIEPEKQPRKIEKVGDMPIAECPNCHRRIPADSKICPYCGAKFDHSIAICGSCGKPIPPDAVVCPYCGAKLR